MEWMYLAEDMCGLVADQATVGELAHGPGVRQLHPLNGIDVNSQIPFVHRIRMNTDQQRKIAGDHQPLDVMGIGVCQRLADGGAQTIHAGFAGPLKIGQGGQVIKIIHGFQSGKKIPSGSAFYRQKILLALAVWSKNARYPLPQPEVAGSFPDF